MPEATASDFKLTQYLIEAYGKEKELETSLQAHISMTERKPYKNRLKQHLSETKRHARLVERRIKAHDGGGQTMAGLAKRAVATAKGPLHMLRGSGSEEKQLKNAKTQYSEEHEEIATYTSIEVLAEEVGDKETAKVARQIRREEERMAAFLERQIPVLTRAVVKAEIPASERNGRQSGARRASRSPGRPARTTGGRTTGARTTKSRSQSSRSRSGSRSGRARAGAARS